MWMDTLKSIYRVFIEIPNLTLQLYLIVINYIFRNTLNGKIVLLTGASSGIGRALAKRLYQSKCKLILASRNESELNALKDELIKNSKDNLNLPIVFPIDLSDAKSIPSRSQQALEIFGKIDVVINNAGITHRSNVIDTDLEVHRKIMQVNYFGAISLIKEMLSSMVSRKSGHIVNVSSLQGLFAMPNRSAYSASKHAIQAFSDSLRAETAALGIKVTVINPGQVNTNLSPNAFSGGGGNHGLKDPNHLQGYSADFMAKIIVLSIQGEQKEVNVSKMHHLLVVYIRRFIPSLYFWIVKQMSSKNKPHTN